MPEITDEQYNEYQSLKWRVAVESMRSVTKLEDDIDVPIKKCVMAFALLGCNPTWSCCGFNYVGQPVHKKHQSGRLYFILGNSRKSIILFHMIGNSTMAYRNHWEIRHTGSGAVDLHLDFSNVVPDWKEDACIHYSEQAVQIIKDLEAWLMSLSSEFLDSTEIIDSNKLYRKHFDNWQYEPKSSWIIRKEDLLKGD